jgi:hypothetical protein
VRLTLQTDDGALIYMSYRGVRHGSAEVTARLARGERVDPSEYYLRTAPFFETAALQSAWASGDPMEPCTKSSRSSELLLRGCCAPARVEHSAGHRYYAVAQVEQLNRLLVFKDLGFSLREMSSFSRSELHQK